MANIRPFVAIRPAKEMAGEIAALPYDVYSRAEAAEYVKEHPHSFLAIDRAETGLPDSVDMYGDAVYRRAHDLLWQWVEEGLFVRDTAPCYYIYEQIMEGRTQSGIVACASIDDYDTGVIKRHENTLRNKEEDRVRHVDETNAQTGPIFLAYRKNAVISEIVSKKEQEPPIYDFVSEDGVIQKVWVISDTREIDIIREAFGSIQDIYIADGHHRAASAVRVGKMRRESHPNYTGEEEFNYFLSVLFPDEELKIMDYNRVVRDLNGYTPADFLKKLEYIAVPLSSDLICPSKRGEFSVYLDEKWHVFAFREDLRPGDAVEGLDVSLLQNLVLEPVLGIHNPKEDERIDFVGGIRGLSELERRCHSDSAVAFAMYPTSIEELFAVADEGRLMPPKSTWFEPKLRSGLFIHELDR